MFKKFFLPLIMAPLLVGCLGSEDVFDDQDQYLEDLRLIDTYLNEQGIEAEVEPTTGIRYVVHSQGTGLQPYLVDSVTLDINGSLLTGEQFIAETGLKKKWAALLDGTSVALNQIQEGGAVTAYIPSFYAYGQAGTTDVPENTVVIMELKLTEVHARQLKKEIAAIDDSLATWGKVAVKDPSGIRYILHNSGTGDNPTNASSITVDYEGRLLGRNSSFDSGTDATFVLGNLISAWKMILPKVKEGGSITLYTPSVFAYGYKGAGEDIPPYATLEFDIDLKTVQ